MRKYAFKRGWGKIKQADAPLLREEISKVLNIKSRQTWSNRLNGRGEPRVSEKEAIEAIFKKYGIPAKDVWGE